MMDSHGKESILRGIDDILAQMDKNVRGLTRPGAAPGSIGIALNGCQITGLMPSGPAALSNMRIGDTVLAVNGRKVDETTASSLMVGPEGSMIQVTVQKAGTRTSSTSDLMRVSSAKLLKLHLLSEVLNQMATSGEVSDDVIEGIDRAMTLSQELQQVTSKSEQDLRMRMSSDQVILLTQIASVIDFLRPLRHNISGVSGSTDDEKIIIELTDAQLKLHTEMEMRSKIEQDKLKVEREKAKAEQEKAVAEQQKSLAQEKLRDSEATVRKLQSELEALEGKNKETQGAGDDKQRLEASLRESHAAAKDLQAKMDAMMSRDLDLARKHASEVQAANDKVLRMEKEQEAYLQTLRRVQLEHQAAQDRIAILDSENAGRRVSGANIAVLEKQLHDSKRERDEVARKARISELEASRQMMHLKKQRDELDFALREGEERSSRMKDMVMGSEKLREELSAANDKIQQLRQEVVVHVERNDSLLKQKLELDKQVENMKEAIVNKERMQVKTVSLEQERETLIKAFNEERRTFMDQIKSLKHSVSQTTEISTRHKVLEDERERLVDELNELRASSISQSQDVSKIKALEAEKDRLVHKLEELGKKSSGRLEIAHKRASEAEANVREIEAQLSSTLAQYQDKCDALNALRDELSRLNLSEGLRKSLASKNEHLEAELQQRDDKIDHLRRQLHESRQAKQQLEMSTSGRHSPIESELENVVEELNDMASALNAAQVEIRRLSNLCTQQQDRITQLERDCNHLRAGKANQPATYISTAPDSLAIRNKFSTNFEPVGPPSVVPRTPLHQDDEDTLASAHCFPNSSLAASRSEAGSLNSRSEAGSLNSRSEAGSLNSRSEAGSLNSRHHSTSVEDEAIKTRESKYNQSSGPPNIVTTTITPRQQRQHQERGRQEAFEVSQSPLEQKYQPKNLPHPFHAPHRPTLVTSAANHAFAAADRPSQGPSQHRGRPADRGQQNRDVLSPWALAAKRSTSASPSRPVPPSNAGGSLRSSWSYYSTPSLQGGSLGGSIYGSADSLPDSLNGSLNANGSLNGSMNGRSSFEKPSHQMHQMPYLQSRQMPPIRHERVPIWSNWGSPY